MNYAEMSDFEINMAVSKLTGTYRYIESNPEFSKHMGRNYCNSWADAGPIIVENKISLSNAIIRWDASSLVCDDKFDAGFKIYRSNSGVDSSSRGALRAAMIVFLMMQEEK